MERERISTTESVISHGEQLAAVTNGIVQLFREYYGRGPNKAKSFLLDGYIVVCVPEDTMTTVEQTLVKHGNGDMVRQVRLVFQEAMADQFKGVVEKAMGRTVATYHSQLTMDPDMGFEFFVLEN
jgi:uncharacterized protein YbcI